ASTFISRLYNTRSLDSHGGSLYRLLMLINDNSFNGLSILREHHVCTIYPSYDKYRQPSVVRSQKLFTMSLLRINRFYHYNLFLIDYFLYIKDIFFNNNILTWLGFHLIMGCEHYSFFYK